MNRRDAWRKAIKASQLKPLVRFVALVMADYWDDGEVVMWCEEATLLTETGVSRGFLYKALDVLRGEGWLVQVERARQHRSPRYMPVIPSQGSTAWTSGSVDNPSQGSTPWTPDGDEGSQGSTWWTPGKESGSQGSTAWTSDNAQNTQGSMPWTSEGPRGPRGGPDFGGGDYSPPPVPHQDATQDPHLVVVVSDVIGDLMEAVVAAAPPARTATALRDECTRLAELHWTPTALQAVLGSPDRWRGSQPGGVIKALRNLTRPPAPPTPPGRATPRIECPNHPGQHGGHCPLCAAAATAPAEGWRSQAKNRSSGAA